MTPILKSETNLYGQAKVAVVGAGLSGVMCARRLRDHGLEVIVIEKSRGPGGRMATRWAETNLGFDHGAQYFTARDRNFALYVQTLIQQGFVAEWLGRIVEVEEGKVTPKTDQPNRYVGVPGMNAVASHLAIDLPIRLETRITQIQRDQSNWQLTCDNQLKYAPFDYLVISLPAPQAAELLGDHPFASEARAVPMTPCWAVMASFESPVEVPFDGAFVHGSPLAWIARNSSKPGRNSSVDCWVLHGSADWSAIHRDCAPQTVIEVLLGEFAMLTRRPLPKTVHRAAHRWLYSSPLLSVDRQLLFDAEQGLAVCGDWLAGGRVEGAFKSGVAAASGILRKIGIKPEIIINRDQPASIR